MFTTTASAPRHDFRLQNILDADMRQQFFFFCSFYSTPYISLFGFQSVFFFFAGGEVFVRPDVPVQVPPRGSGGAADPGESRQAIAKGQTSSSLLHLVKLQPRLGSATAGGGGDGWECRDERERQRSFVKVTGAPAPWGRRGERASRRRRRRRSMPAWSR